MHLANTLVLPPRSTILWKQERLNAVTMSCPSRTHEEFIRPMNFFISSSDLCGVFQGLNWILTQQQTDQKQKSPHRPVKSLEDIFGWKTKCLFILILSLPALWRKINYCLYSVTHSVIWNQWKPLTWWHPPCCSTAGRWFGTGRWSCHEETWRCHWPGKGWPHQCCCTTLF